MADCTRLFQKKNLIPFWLAGVIVNEQARRMEDKTIKFSDRFLSFSKQTALVAVFIIGVLVSFPDLCFAEPNQVILGEEQKRAVHIALEGDWICNIGSTKIRLHFTDDSKFSLNEKEGSYLVEGTKLTLKSGSSQAVYDFDLEPLTK